MELNQLKRTLKDLGERTASLGGFFEYDNKKERLEEVTRELEDPAVWQNADRARELGQRTLEAGRASSPSWITPPSRSPTPKSCWSSRKRRTTTGVAAEIEKDSKELEDLVRKLELKRMFHGEMDSHNAFMDIQAGAGGTEAQDWANMLMRMYLRWAAARGFHC